jgi:hypothetical protein
MPEYKVLVDMIHVHELTVTAATPEEAEAQAERLAAAGLTSAPHHVEPPVVGDAELLN